MTSLPHPAAYSKPVVMASAYSIYVFIPHTQNSASLMSKFFKEEIITNVTHGYGKSFDISKVKLAPRHTHPLLEGSGAQNKAPSVTVNDW